MNAATFGHQQVDIARSEWTLIKAADEQRKARATQQAAKHDADLAANATPETLRHHRICVADRLAASEQLTAEERRAAREIAEIFEAITRGLFSKVARYSDAGGGGGCASIPAGLCVAHSERYKPWCDEQAKIIVQGNYSCVDVVLFMAVDNLGCTQIAMRIGCHRRRVLSALRESLYRYAERAEWLEKTINSSARPAIVVDLEKAA